MKMESLNELKRSGQEILDAILASPRRYHGMRGLGAILSS
jgi:hypothetical protein